MSKTKFTLSSSVDTWASHADGIFEKNKLVPHIVAGGEFFVAKRFSIGLNVKYMFGGKLDDFEGHLSDPDNISNYGGSGQYRLIITSRDMYENLEGLKLQKTSEAMSNGDRLFAYDYSGIRINLSAKYYFGGND